VGVSDEFDPAVIITLEKTTLLLGSERESLDPSGSRTLYVMNYITCCAQRTMHLFLHLLFTLGCISVCCHVYSTVTN